MNWTETEKLDRFKRREFVVSFESSYEYDDFYADCQSVGLDYHPLGYFSKPPRDKLACANPDVLVYFYFENNIIRWSDYRSLERSRAAGAEIVPYSKLVACSDHIPIPNDILKMLCSEI